MYRIITYAVVTGINRVIFDCTITTNSIITCSYMYNLPGISRHFPVRKAVNVIMRIIGDGLLCSPGSSPIGCFFVGYIMRETSDLVNVYLIPDLGIFPVYT